MGMIIFENDPPYERLEAQSAQAIPTSDGVELVLSAGIETLRMAWSSGTGCVPWAFGTS